VNKPTGPTSNALLRQRWAAILVIKRRTAVFKPFTRS